MTNNINCSINLIIILICNFLNCIGHWRIRIFCSSICRRIIMSVWSNINFHNRRNSGLARNKPYFKITVAVEIICRISGRHFCCKAICKVTGTISSCKLYPDFASCDRAVNYDWMENRSSSIISANKDIIGITFQLAASVRFENLIIFYDDSPAYMQQADSNIYCAAPYLVWISIPINWFIAGNLAVFKIYGTFRTDSRTAVCNNTFNRRIFKIKLCSRCRKKTAITIRLVICLIRSKIDVAELHLLRVFQINKSLRSTIWTAGMSINFKSYRGICHSTLFTDKLYKHSVFRAVAPGRVNFVCTGIIRKNVDCISDWAIGICCLQIIKLWISGCCIFDWMCRTSIISIITACTDINIKNRLLPFCIEDFVCCIGDIKGGYRTSAKIRIVIPAKELIRSVWICWRSSCRISVYKGWFTGKSKYSVCSTIAGITNLNALSIRRIPFGIAQNILNSVNSFCIWKSNCSGRFYAGIYAHELAPAVYYFCFRAGPLLVSIFKEAYINNIITAGTYRFTC